MVCAVLKSLLEAHEALSTAYMQKPPNNSDLIQKYLTADSHNRDRIVYTNPDVFLEGMPKYLRRFDLALRPLCSSWAPELVMCECSREFHNELLDKMLIAWVELWREDVPAVTALYPKDIIKDSIKNCFR